MENSIKAACDILARTTQNDKFEYVEYFEYGAWNGYGYNGFIDYNDQVYYLIQYISEHGVEEWYETFARSKAEAVGHFVMDNPKVSYENIIDVCVDKNTYQYI